jgi:hypothetical protein
MTHPACINCKKLGNCGTVDEQKLYQSYYCGDWEEVDNQAEINARKHIIQRFGLAGATALINFNNNTD